MFTLISDFSTPTERRKTQWLRSKSLWESRDSCLQSTAIVMGRRPEGRLKISSEQSQRPYGNETQTSLHVAWSVIEFTITVQLQLKGFVNDVQRLVIKNIYINNDPYQNFFKKMTFTIKSETDNKISEIVNLGQQLIQHKSSQQGRSAAQRCQ